MAKVNQICVCVFLFVLMFSYGIVCTEARALKDKKRDCKSCVTVNGNKRSDLNAHIFEEPAADSEPTAEEGSNSQSVHPGAGNVTHKTDDLRPTAPGHSPGAGHSTGPSSIGPNS